MLLTSKELAKIWGISSRRVSFLCSEGRLVGAIKKGKTWLIPDSIQKPEDLRMKTIGIENQQMLNIQNRRYLGNKYKLLEFIDQTINKNCKNVNSIFDVFAGTGVVAYHFMDRMKVVTNDILYSNHLAHIAFMSNEKINARIVNETIKMFNEVNAEKLADNYMSKTFADTYFSREDCKKIGFAREYVEKQFRVRKINPRERAILITVILYAMDRIANTCGHYDAYRKGIAFDRSIEFFPLNLSKKPRMKNLFYNGDSNELISDEKFPEVDCVYCDPPYNSRNYCDLYHVLENVAKWEKPRVIGVAKKMDRTSLKSKYCGKEAAVAFDDLVQKLRCKYIILSYNNTGFSSDNRSNARMTDEEIIRILSKKGDVKVYSKKYKAFTAGKSDNTTNEERLFICTVAKKEAVNNNLIKSPLNFTGGKTKLLPQILPYFPRKIESFYDVFCGGANVGINVAANKVIFTDSNEELIGLYKTFSRYSAQKLINMINRIIDKYDLSKSEVNGYEFYGCNSADGLGDYNRDKYLELRKDFNSLSRKNDEYYIMLYVLIIYAFNNQIRFNKDNKFNLPVGKRDFNKNIRLNFIKFIEALNRKGNYFFCRDFRNIDYEKIGKNDFVYCDPPYLIATASYNEQDGWNEKLETDLLKMLDDLNSRGIKFALSNVMVHKGKINRILTIWAKKYRVNKLSYNYSNSNYHGKDKDKETQEVLITNY